MYLIDLAKVVSEADNQDDVLNATEGVWSAIYERMDPTETCGSSHRTRTEMGVCGLLRWQ